MNEIQVLNFKPGQRIRATVDDDVVWVAAADVCAVLDLDNVAKAVARLDDDEKRDDITTSDVIGRRQAIWFVNEPGIYRLIFSSRKPEAIEFKRWVFHDVLPAIARQGFYVSPAALDRFDIISVQSQAMLIELDRQRELMDKRIRKIEALLELRAGASEWMSVNAYRVNIGLEPLGVNELIKAAMSANYLSDEQGYGVLRHSGGALGSRNQYHINVLNIMYPANRDEPGA